MFLQLQFGILIVSLADMTIKTRREENLESHF